MFYYETSEKGNKITGAAAAVLYVLFWVVLLVLVKYSFEPKDYMEGMLIDFGDTENASGFSDPNISQLPTDMSSNSSDEGFDPEDIMTQDYEEAPEVAPVQQERPRERDRNETPQQTPQPPQPVERPRQADPRALFPGQTPGSASTSEGSTQGTGNQGSPEGTQGGAHDGSGVGAGGTGFDLAGRSVIGSLPSPTYGANKSGRVIIEITVNPAGQVTNASYRPVGSTTNDSELVNAALRAARQSRFSTIEAENNQTGTITYNFRLR